MSEDDAAKMKERPVEPLVIDGEAAEASGEQPKSEAAEASGEQRTSEEQPESDSTAPKLRHGASSWRRAVVAICAAGVLIGLAVWALSASGVRIATGTDDRVEALAQRIGAAEAANGAMREEIGRLTSLADETKSKLDQVSSEATGNLDELRSKMGAMESALQNVQAAIETLNQRAPQPATDDGRLTLLTKRMDELQAKLAAVENATPPATSETRPAEDEQLAAAFADLRKAADSGQPFAVELEKVAALAPAAGGLEELRAHAATGAASAGDLAARLQTIADQSTAPSLPATGDGEQGLWDGLRGRITGLVKIRDLAEARWADGIADAIRLLAGGDSEKALTTLEAIDGKPPEPLRAWMADARARTAVNRATTQLAAAVREQSAGGP
jgi:hypothetical protein